MDNVGMRIGLLGTWSSMVTLKFLFFFLDVNQSGSRTSSTTNHIFERNKEQLCGPWCKTNPHNGSAPIWPGFRKVPTGGGHLTHLPYLLCISCLRQTLWVTAPKHWNDCEYYGSCPTLKSREDLFGMWPKGFLDIAKQINKNNIGAFHLHWREWELVFWLLGGHVGGA